jgi:hypothetical protein
LITKNIYFFEFVLNSEGLLNAIQDFLIADQWGSYIFNSAPIKVLIKDKALELIQLWADVTMMHQGEFEPLFKVYRQLRVDTKLQEEPETFVHLKQISVNMKDHFPNIPALESVSNDLVLLDDKEFL